MLIHLNRNSMHGQFDANTPQCIALHFMAARYEISSSCTVIQANYLGTIFTADVPVDFRLIDCDVMVGHEWISLL
ncbi:hypothetical protein EV363DRAFT_1178358 [Boletus edulis]|nr:hypothetical protein EV363DRAFT_1178358 [Boletus edulis]